MATSIKRYVIIIVTAALVLLIPGMLLAQEVIAYIGEVGGSVIVVKANPGEEVEAELGTLLMGGDIVKTEAVSYASIIFQDDGSRVKLGENSQLRLNATRDKKKLKKRMFLDSGGKLWAKVSKKRGTDFEVRTPTSVASVKGTEYALEEKLFETLLWVFDDAVLLERAGFTVNVGAGQYARATDDGIETFDIGDGDVPIEPGKHEIIFYLDQQGQGTALQQEIRILFEK